MIQITLKSLYHKVCSSIASILNDEKECESIARLLLEHYLGITYTDIILDREIIVDNDVMITIDSALDRLIAGEPIQYIIGHSYFLGRKFLLNSNVLIPRPETEELVHLIIENNKRENLSVLDIGTGSGCIAISLKKELTSPSIVHAIDIDRAALSTATKNAEMLDAEVIFIETDILQATSLPHRYDVIVSNPPYVLESEKDLMKPNVLNYEPHKALFVPTHNPLIFYKKIIELARLSLNPKGKIYFEINEAFGAHISNLLQINSFTGIKIHRDIHNRERIVDACI